MVDASDWPTLGSEGDIKSLKKENPALVVVPAKQQPPQKDRVDVAAAAIAKSQPVNDDIQVSTEVSDKPIEADDDVPKAPVVESIEKVNNASTPTVNVNTARSNPIIDDKAKSYPPTMRSNIADGPRKEHNNSTKSRWNRYDDDKSSSHMSQPPTTTPQQPSRIRQERDDRHATSNRTYGQSNRYTRPSQPPASLTHSTSAATNGKPISNHRGINGYSKRNDDVPANASNYPRSNNRNAKQLIGRPVLINTAVPASIPYAAPPYYFYSNPIIDTVASIKESIKRQM